MSELILVRHGQASFGSENYDKLSPLGETQATICGNHLAEIREQFTATYSGQLKRQIKTATLIQSPLLVKELACPSPVQDSAFNEYDSKVLFESLLYGLLEEEPEQRKNLELIQTDRKAFQILFDKVMKRWISGKYDQKDLPRWETFKSKVKDGISRIMEQHGSKQSVLIATSGGPIAAAVQMALQLNDEMTLELTWQIQNASITRFKFNQQQLTLTGFNDVSHLKLRNDPELLTYR